MTILAVVERCWTHLVDLGRHGEAFPDALPVAVALGEEGVHDACRHGQDQLAATGDELGQAALGTGSLMSRQQGEGKAGSDSARSYERSQVW